MTATSVVFVTTDPVDRSIDRLAAEFNREFSSYFVEVKRFEGTAGQPVTVGEAAAGADCGRSWSPPMSEADRASFLDLQPLLDADLSFPLADYPPALLARFRHQGKLLGLPNGVLPPVLYYNRALFDAAGVPYPSAAWTLADFSAAATQLTSGTGTDRQYGFAAVSPFDLFLYLERSGTALDQLRNGVREPRFTDPSVVAATREYLALLRSVSPNQQLEGYGRDSGSGVYGMVAAGKVAMWHGHGLDATRSGGELSFPVGVAPLPLGDRPLAVDDLSVSGLFISAQSKSPAACWAFLRFLSDDTSHLWREMPARTSLVEAPAFIERAPQGAAEVYRAYSASLAQSQQGADVPPFTGASLYWLLRAVDRAYQGADLEIELADAQFHTEQYLACLQGGERAGVCARQVDPTYDGWVQP